MRKLILLTAAFALATAASAQQITFCSPEFESGVKTHLGLGEESRVEQSQTDTITAIDLSRLGITDLRDVVYLSNVRTLNLAGNDITDVAPLLVLDSLRTVDLSWNRIERIDLLAFSNSEELQVSVGYNYIDDFGFLLSPSARRLNIIGMGCQRVMGGGYFDVCHFYADVDAEGTPLVRYRGYTNEPAAAYVECGAVREAALLDGDTHAALLNGVAETSMAWLGNGTLGDSTFVVPVTNGTLSPGDSITIETGLPDGYTLQGFSPAQQGTMAIDGLRLTYTAAADFVREEYSYAYYADGRLKGFSKVVLASGIATAVDHPVVADAPLAVSRAGVGKLHVTCDARLLSPSSVLRVYSASGMLLYEERVDTADGLQRDIALGKSVRGVVVVQLESGQRVFTEKTVM